MSYFAHGVSPPEGFLMLSLLPLSKSHDYG
jgi:hypothetical protein